MVGKLAVNMPFSMAFHEASVYIFSSFFLFSRSFRSPKEFTTATNIFLDLAPFPKLMYLNAQLVFNKVCSVDQIHLTSVEHTGKPAGEMKGTNSESLPMTSRSFTSEESTRIVGRATRTTEIKNDCTRKRENEKS